METKFITPKGIVRNTSPATSEDGQFDEMVNLRHKDGSLRPIGESKEIEWEGTAPNLSEYIKMFVHNASNYKHLLGIKSDKKLYWFATMDTDYKATAVGPTSLLTVSTTDAEADNVFFAQVGNLVTVADGERLKYLLFKESENRYVIADVDYNGKGDTTQLLPEGVIDFRVVNDKHPNGSSALHVYEPDERTWTGDEGGLTYDENSKASEDSDYIYVNENGKIIKKAVDDVCRAMLTTVQAKDIEQGRLNGFFLACTAVELYDGSTILMSRPVLMSQPNDAATRDIDPKHNPLNIRNFDEEGKLYTSLSSVEGAQSSGENYTKRFDESNNWAVKNEKYSEYIFPTVFKSEDVHQRYSDEDQAAHFKTFQMFAQKFQNNKGITIGKNVHIFKETGHYTSCVFFTMMSTMVGKISTSMSEADGEFAQCVSDLCVYRGTASDDDKNRCHPGAINYFSRGVIPVNTPPNLFCLYSGYVYKHQGHSGDGAVWRNSYATSLSGWNDGRPSVWLGNARTMHGCDFIPSYSAAERGNIVGVSSTNKLQIKFNYNADPNYVDIIKSINVYITMPVSPYKDNVKYTKISHPWGSDVKPLIHGVTAYLEQKSMSEIKKELMENRNIFYKVASIPYSSIENTATWKDIDLKTNDLLKNLAQQPKLDTDSMDRNSYNAGYVYSYNGKLHIADYTKQIFKGWPIGYFYQKWESEKREVLHYNYFLSNLPGWSDAQTGYMIIDPDSTIQGSVRSYTTSTQANMELSGTCYANNNLAKTGESDKLMDCIEVDIQLTDRVVTVRRYRLNNQVNGNANNYVLNGLLSYPDARAKEMRIITYINDGNPRKVTSKFTLTPHNTYNFAYFISKNLRPIRITNSCDDCGYTETKGSVGEQNPPEDTNIYEYFPNGLKVSMTNNPLFFSNESTYQIGNSRIIAMCANTMALSTGQWGDAPLYVFCADGVYALMVDSTGQLTYSNARPISREICNNANSVTPIDDAIVFTTSRGLVMMSGSEPKEISQEGEGRVYDILNSSSNDHLAGMSVMLNNEHLTSLLQVEGDITVNTAGVGDNVELTEYLKDVRIGYNYAERELFVTNPAYNYSYVYTNGYWTKTTKKCSYYIPDYPKTYAKVGAKLFNINEEKTEAGNQCVIVSRPIKCSTLSEKQTYRVVIRGNFHMKTKEV